MRKLIVPVQAGDLIGLRISGYTGEGLGVGRYEGFTIFVPGALKEETIKAQIKFVKKNYAQAILKEVLEESDQRIKPICPLFDSCGGCQLQHLDYEGQLEFKRQRVQDALERLGGFKDIVVKPVMEMTEPWYYRNKGRYAVTTNEKKEIIIGYKEEGSHKIVDIPDCYIQNKLLTKLVNEIREVCQILYDKETIEKEGFKAFHHILVKSCNLGDRAMVILEGNSSQATKEIELAKRLVDKFPSLKGVIKVVADERGIVRQKGREDSIKVLYGQGTFSDSMLNLNQEGSPLAFSQVNSKQTEKLYGKALEYASLTGEETVLDAYCGTGILSLLLAQKAQAVYGIEIDYRAIKDAKRNCQLNKITNATFIAGATERVLPNLNEKKIAFDLAVLNPPRSGCAEATLEALSRAKTNKVIYISCNPATLARDLKYLNQRGYLIKEVQPLDLFPHTYHVETVVLMSRVKE